MQAYHSFWSKPNRGRHYGRVEVPDFELFALVLSALKWQQLNGTIGMITDSAGAEFFAANGLEDLWSTPIAVTLDSIDSGIDPFLFWAAGKLHALASAPCACVMLDTDMIVWKDVSGLLGQDVVTAHPEPLLSPVYPAPEIFRVKPEYTFPSEWDFSAAPANTAFLYMPNEELRDYYVESAFAFIGALDGGGIDPTVTMCFAEQRVLPMCVKAKGGQLKHLFSEQEMYSQQFITHLWGNKQVMERNRSERDLFCTRCATRILVEFPQWAQRLQASPVLRPFLQRSSSSWRLRAARPAETD